MLTKKGILFLVFGLTIFLIYLYFFIGIREVVEALQKTHLVYFSLAFMSLLVGTIFYSLVWQQILGLLQIKSAFHKTFSFVWIASFVDLVIPAESSGGDLSKVYLMSTSSGENMGKVAASVVSHRILTMTNMLFGIIVGSTFLFFGYETSPLVVNLMLFVAASTVVALFLLCYLSLKPRVTMKIAALIVRFLSFVSRGRWELSRFKPELEEALTAFHQGMRILTEKPKKLLAPFLFSAVSFLLNLSISFLVLLSLGSPVSFGVVLIVYTIVGAIQSIPLGILGELGMTDVAMTSLYSLLGIPAGISGAATVLTRVLTVWLRIFAGYVAVQRVGIAIPHGHDARNQFSLSRALERNKRKN